MKKDELFVQFSSAYERLKEALSLPPPMSARKDAKSAKERMNQVTYQWEERLPDG